MKIIISNGRTDTVFGTDGIRGRFGQHPITTDYIGRLIFSIYSLYLVSNKTVVVGRDTRTSSIILANTVLHILVSLGCKVIFIDVVPSSAVSFFVIRERASLGIMISASHNKSCDNGIKFISSDGSKIDYNAEQKIYTNIKSSHTYCDVSCTGSIVYFNDANSIYADYICSHLEIGLPPNIKILVDCSNGSAIQLAKQVLERFNVSIVLINNIPNGHNINIDSGVLHPDHLINAVHQNKCDLGISLDGDGDRISICNKNGEYIDGEQIACMIGLSLKVDRIVTTHLSSIVTEQLMMQSGIQTVYSEPGDKNVYQMMVKLNIDIGYESSGHIIFKDFIPVSDGIVSLCKLIQHCGYDQIIKATRRDYCMIKYNIDNIRGMDDVLKIESNINYSVLKIQSNQISQNHRLETSKCVIRISGTENIVKLYIFSDNNETLDLIYNAISHLI